MINEHEDTHHLMYTNKADNANPGELPFLDQLLENPVKFSLGNILPAVADDVKTKDNDETSERSLKDMKKHSFCSGMMMGGHEMAQHGVGPMALGGGMSGGMVMYMDGFRFAMAGNQPCLNLYFPSWTLDTRTKFIGALLFVFGLSFATEAVSKFRHNLTARPAGREYQARRTRQMVISGLHGFQALLGYVVMLATMTFSVEILLSVVLGLSAGYYYYFAGESGLEGHVTTNPCCNFMQDESDEHEQRQHQQQQQPLPQQVSTTVGEPSCCSEDSATIGLLAAASGERPGSFADTAHV